MPRITVADVQQIYPTTVDLLPFVLAASTLVDLYFGTSTYTTTQLAELERFWAAHLATGQSTGVVETTLGDTSIRYSESKVTSGLNSTRFGETVLLLDTDKILATSERAVGSIINVPLLRV